MYLLDTFVWVRLTVRDAPVTLPCQPSHWRRQCEPVVQPFDPPDRCKHRYAHPWQHTKVIHSDTQHKINITSKSYADQKKMVWGEILYKEHITHSIVHNSIFIFVDIKSIIYHNRISNRKYSRNTLSRI